MKKIIFLLLMLCNVCSASNQIGYLLGPTGSKLELVFTYPTSLSEHSVNLDIYGGHFSEDVQLESDDMSYTVRYRVSGTVYSHTFSVASLSPAGVTISDINCSIDFEDGSTGHFEFKPLGGDSTHPKFDFSASGTSYSSVILGNKADTVNIGAFTLINFYLNKGQDFFVTGGSGMAIVHSGGGIDTVGGGNGTSDTLYTGPAIGGVYDIEVDFETVNHNYEEEFFPMTQW